MMHIFDTMACLHWLRVPERFEFKIAVLTYKSSTDLRRGTVPGPFHTCRRPTQSSLRSLRSVGTSFLVVPTNRLSTVGSRAFPVTGPQTWNDLPEHVTSAESLTIHFVVSSNRHRNRVGRVGQVLE